MPFRGVSRFCTAPAGSKRDSRLQPWPASLCSISSYVYKLLVWLPAFTGFFLVQPSRYTAGYSKVSRKRHGEAFKASIPLEKGDKCRNLNFAPKA